MQRIPTIESIVRALQILQWFNEDDVWDMQSIYYKEYGLSRAEFLDIPITQVHRQVTRIAERRRKEQRDLERANNARGGGRVPTTGRR